ncbi:Dimethyl sulfoxide reductase DmsA [Sporomusa acidovorans DSM 3132]|uniref:Dimethyl sulfoxide reductase DmsA n=1 Tax=Sporomusa acidovorans (strain ATCC 49682 / DSM 3132 / Mol) TaxID=1123286 RepID=A0ABZ3J859_SPOA4|nr:dimethyl sulfoxide reductase DmsA precursor [Sporomusa acidovorans DSM 3132]SDD91198.1 Anaerobic selenocysteine-containing dehydrogenase [Sporomusa acidovorans]
MQRISGDPLLHYTRGYLCQKVLSYLDVFYHPDRILSPLQQIPRGSGNWRVISWEEALGHIAGNIIKLTDDYGSFLPLCIIKNTGNLGLLHEAWNWFARSFAGGTSRISGTVCWNALVDAFYYTVGPCAPPPPEKMADSKLIFLWGVNPAWTSIHQMHYLEQARLHGATIVVIDPVLTVTAAKADIYIQISPGTDAEFALAMVYHLIQTSQIDVDFLQNKVEGWQEFYEYVTRLNPLELAAETGVPYKHIQRLADRYAAVPSAALWLGLGMQRYKNGGNNVRAILALTALTGHIQNQHLYSSNTYYGNLFCTEWDWMYSAAAIRKFPAYRLADSLQEATVPPIRTAIIAASNPLVQLSETTKLAQRLTKLDLVVVVGQFLSETARVADIFLPTTTWLEHWDVVPGYWHNWLGISEPAVQPRGQCLADIEIVTRLSTYLNALSPGICSFPVKTQEEWLQAVFTPDVLHSLQIKDYRELLLGPKEYKGLPQYITNNKFQTPSGKFVISTANLPVPQAARNSTAKAFPYRLLTPHVTSLLNSQFSNMAEGERACIIVNQQIAREKGLQSGKNVLLFNKLGEIKIKAFISNAVAPGVVYYYAGEGTEEGINKLIPSEPTDLGDCQCNDKGLALNDTFVDVAALVNFK